MSDENSNRGKRRQQKKEQVVATRIAREEAARIAEEETKTADEAARVEAETTKKATIVKRNGKKPVTRKKLETSSEEPKSPRVAFRVSLEAISDGSDEYINASYTYKKGIKTSVSGHTAFQHKDFEVVIPVIIPKATVPYKRQPSKRLNEDGVGEWVRVNVPGWRKGIWFSRIGHTNIVSDEPLDVTKDIVGDVLISSKRVKQNDERKGKMDYFFPHLIVTKTGNKIEPAFRLAINDLRGEDVPGMVHIGPTVGALYNGAEVKEYLHLEPCE